MDPNTNGNGEVPEEVIQEALKESEEPTGPWLRLELVPNKGLKIESNVLNNEMALFYLLKKFEISYIRGIGVKAPNSRTPGGLVIPKIVMPR